MTNTTANIIMTSTIMILLETNGSFKSVINLNPTSNSNAIINITEIKNGEGEADFEAVREVFNNISKDANVITEINEDNVLVILERNHEEALSFESWWDIYHIRIYMNNSQTHSNEFTGVIKVCGDEKFYTIHICMV